MVADREWYASLMLNRLMFVYFIQKKGFLDGDTTYLQNRLATVQAREGRGNFLDFYRSFLVALFHEGFAKKPEHWNVLAEQRDLIGNVPYLNGGLFDVHELEESHPNIRIPDEAFEAIFKFFDQYEWTLDTRPISKGNEINPDVLGYIFEKYINQKQMERITPRRTLPTTSARTRSFPISSMRLARTASSRSMRARRFGGC